ncbi:BED zinc finger [Ancylostoma caninum]|uniref:BED zinc finger n=1 Tax=Ancylostoma caninum TaxID=29170 RepID=A0A368FCY0_ANCCA|nr:BED zinc finger [Ancylostoma caninum]
MSTVWNYYKRMVEAGSNSELAICKFCSRSFNIPKSRTTTNLLEHIRRKHKEEAEESTSTFTGDNDSTNNNQPKLEEMFKRKMNLAVRKKIDRKVVNFIANASVPLNVVTHPSFKDLLGTLNNSYTVPSRASIERLMREQVQCIDESNKKLFADEDVNIAITADSWTSKNASCSLLAITGHALGKDFEDRRNVILDCVPLEEESHTSEIIAAKVLETLARLGITTERISFVVADGAAVMVKMASDLGLPYIHCCAHLVNLAVSASMNYPMSAQALRKVKSIVSRLNKSGKMKKMFRRYLKEEQLPDVIPMNDAPTRWSSTYFMLCDVLNALPAVEKLMHAHRMAPFEDEEIRVLKAMKVFLQPFQTMTSQVCFQSSCISMFIPVGKLLITETEKNLVDARREGLHFGEQLLEKTKQYFAKWFNNQHLRLAALCDPRFAHLDTVLTREEWRQTVDHFISMKVSSARSEETKETVTKQQSARKESSVWSLLTSPKSTDAPSKTVRLKEEGLQVELQQYSIFLNGDEARPDPAEDPIAWWRSHRDRFPLLAETVPRFLVAPCTSVDTERLFSSAGIIYGNKRRGRLSGKNARLLLMINASGKNETCRPSKAWSQRDIERYGNVGDMADVYSTSDDDVEDEEDSSEELE